MKNNKVSVSLLALCITTLLNTQASAVTLQDAVKQTLAVNPDFRLQLDRRHTVNYQYAETRARYYPTVDISGSYGRTRTRSPTTQNQWTSFWSQELGIVANENLFEGFITQNEVKRQRARVDSAAYSVLDSAQTVTLETVRAYLNLVTEHELLNYARDNRDTHKTTYGRVKLRSESGFGREADLDQMEGRLSRAEANLIAAEANLTDAKTTYRKVIGVLPGEALEPPTGLLSGFLPTSLEATLKQAFLNHPLVRKAHIDIEAAKSQHATAKGAFWPKLDLQAGINRDEDVGGSEGRDEEMFIRLNLRYQIYSGGADHAKKKQAASQINEAKDVKSNTYRELVESTRLSWTAHQATKKQSEYLFSFVAAADKTRHSYAEQFDIGKRTLLDLLDSETEFFNANTDYARIKRDYIIAQYRLLADMGCLIQVLDIEEITEADPPFGIVAQQEIAFPTQAEQETASQQGSDTVVCPGIDPQEQAQGRRNKLNLVTKRQHAEKDAIE